jgi:hypothetical protein
MKSFVLAEWICGVALKTSSISPLALKLIFKAIQSVAMPKRNEGENL